MESGNQSSNNKNNKGIFPPIINSMMNRASGASQIIQQEENARQRNSIPSATQANNNIVSGVSALSNGNYKNNNVSNAVTEKPQMANSRVSSPRRSSSQAKNTATSEGRNSMSSAAGELSTKMTSGSANSTVPMNNSVGGGAMMPAANEVGPKELNGLVDVIMTSDMDRPVKRQLLKVILNNIKTITDRDDKEIDDMRDKYTAGAYMASSLMPQVQSQLGMPPSPYGMPPSPSGMTPSPYGMPPSPYGRPPSP